MNAQHTAQVLFQMITDGTDGTVTRYGVKADQTRGYWVGGIRPSLVFAPDSRRNFGDVLWFVQSTPLAEYFGVWTDEDGTVYVDASDWTPSRGNALAMGRERGELAVWDIARCQEVRCNTVNQGAY